MIRKNWFLISLVLVLVGGFQSAQPLAGLASLNWLKWLIVMLTMFLMAWPLEFGSLQRAVAKPVAPLLASVLNMVAIPLLVWPWAVWVGGELGGGMLVAAATPCTLASAAVWTRRAGGDDSVAIMVTILTNVTCFLVMPFWIFVQTGSSMERAQLIDTIYKLFFFVVMPIVAAQLVRLNHDSARWATERKSLLSSFAMLGVLSMVFIGAISMGLRLGEQNNGIQLMSVVWVGLLLGGVHCLVFWGGMLTARLIGLERDQQIAVGFSGSQKTLMIGLTVSISLGMSIIPIVLYHAIQLIVDTVFADRLRGSNS